MGTGGQEKGEETTGVRGWHPRSAANSPINIYEFGPRWGRVQSQGRCRVKGNPRAAENGEALGKETAKWGKLELPCTLLYTEIEMKHRGQESDKGENASLKASICFLRKKQNLPKGAQNQ